MRSIDMLRSTKHRVGQPTAKGDKTDKDRCDPKSGIPFRISWDLMRIQS